MSLYMEYKCVCMREIDLFGVLLQAKRVLLQVVQSERRDGLRLLKRLANTWSVDGVLTRSWWSSWRPHRAQQPKQEHMSD